MRIFIFILSLIFSAAFVLLNVLGFNGVLTYNEFFLVNVIAEVLVCLVLGHFMYRTYANHKKLKKLQQELTTRQASNVAQEQSVKNSRSLKRRKKADNTTAKTSASPYETQPQQTAYKAPAQKQAPAAQAAPAHTTQPMQPASSNAPSRKQAPTAQATPAHTTQPMQPASSNAPSRKQAPTAQAAPTHTTQPMQPVQPNTPDPSSTARYNQPFGK